ncbi:hypothetical protein [Lichenicoccus sp.]|uniref:hypothetical protein n=1 Tax=Lichenicoccus sp. TaxID=2781899 RepID=UPI003D0F8DE8
MKQSRTASGYEPIGGQILGGMRYSTFCFYLPQRDTMIEPISVCVPIDRPRLYESCTAEEHEAAMFRRS